MFRTWLQEHSVFVMLLLCFFFYYYCDPRVLHVLTHSFPTRRSSDLCVERGQAQVRSLAQLVVALARVRLELTLADRHQAIGQGRQPHCAKRSEEHTSELQSLMRNSYAVFCLKKKKNKS